MINKHYFIAKRFEHAEFYVLSNGLNYTDMIHVTHVGQIRGLRDICIKVLRNGDKQLADEILLKNPNRNITMEFVNA